MASGLTADQVGDLFRDGVDAVASVAAGLDERRWALPACGVWTGTETARHLLAVSRWYHEWLDRARNGDLSHPFAGPEMDRRNEQTLTAMEGLTGPAAIAEFTDTATAYLARAVENWDLPFAYPYGVVTVGLHCGVAAAEWHLHAWDLSGSATKRHRPDNPAILFRATGSCVAAAEGGLRGAVVQRLVPLGARLTPWQTLLRRSGRDPSS